MGKRAKGYAIKEGNEKETDGDFLHPSIILIHHKEPEKVEDEPTIHERRFPLHPSFQAITQRLGSVPGIHIHSHTFAPNT